MVVILLVCDSILLTAVRLPLTPAVDREEVVDVSDMDLNAEDKASLKKVIEAHPTYFPGENSESWISKMKERVSRQWASHFRRRTAHEAKRKQWEDDMEKIRERKQREGQNQLVSLWVEKQKREMEKTEEDWEKQKSDLERSIESELAGLTLESHLYQEELPRLFSTLHQQHRPSAWRPNRSDGNDWCQPE